MSQRTPSRRLAQPLPARALPAGREAVFHYFYDPYCGWSYGAEPLVRVLRQMEGVRLVLHAGGMLTGTQAIRISDEWATRMQGVDQRIADRTGQPFGMAYRTGLMRDTGHLLDSTFPIAAILAAEELAGQGLDMLSRLQAVHFEQGQRVGEWLALARAAQALGLNPAAFEATWNRLLKADVSAHIRQSRQIMARLGVSQFPTFALAIGDDPWIVMDHTAWLGKVENWRTEVMLQVAGLKAGAAQTA